MIQKLQHRFILITMACIGFIFALILLALNLFMTISNYRQGYTVLEEFSQRQTIKETFPTEKKEFENFRKDENFSAHDNFPPGLKGI